MHTTTTNNLNWPEVLNCLKTSTTKATYNSIFAYTTAERQGDTVTIYSGQPIDPRLKPAIAEAVFVAEGFTPAEIRFSAEPPPPAADTFAVDLIRVFNPDIPFIQAASYAIRFWQPLIGPGPFALWLTLRSFARLDSGEAYPAIQTLADICANGNRHKILGRAAYGQGENRREARPGLIHTLQDWGIAEMTNEGGYRFRIADSLPQLTPEQVSRLSVDLQAAHERWCTRMSYVPDIGKCK